MAKRILHKAYVRVLTWLGLAIDIHSKGKYPESIFGSIDAKKVHSCMNLFNCISPNDIFAEVLDVFLWRRA